MPHTVGMTENAQQPTQPVTVALNPTMVTTTVGVVGALLVVVGSFMPWATLTSGFGSASMAGTDGDGRLTMIAGLALAVLAVSAGVHPTWWLRTVYLLAAALVAATTVLEIIWAGDRAAEASSELAVASVGPGLYMLLVGALIATAAAALHAFWKLR